ncbi:MAG: hypothetical protein ACRD16_00020 [Thermoanaerobaculia bacterium]
MARGWGRSEEDLAAEKEAAKDEARPRDRAPKPTAGEAARRTKIHAVELSLARIAEQLSKTANPDRRKALESARDQLKREREKLAAG